MPANRYVAGQWNIICDSCGLKKKSTEVRKRWDGLIVCKNTCYEQDHPQKYIRVKETGIAVPFIRDQPPDTFNHICWIYEASGYADLASADCAIADGTNFSYTFLYNLKFDSGLSVAGIDSINGYADNYADNYTDSTAVSADSYADLYSDLYS